MVFATPAPVPEIWLDLCFSLSGVFTTPVVNQNRYNGYYACNSNCALHADRFVA